MGQRIKPRKQRTEDRWQGKHSLATWGNTSACTNCGRTSVATRQGKLQQWRRPCIPLDSHRARQEGRHVLGWSGEWFCKNCPIKGKNLGKHGCIGRHPTGRKRFRTKQPAIGPQGGPPSLFGGPKGESDLCKEVQRKRVCGGVLSQQQPKRQCLIGDLFDTGRSADAGATTERGAVGKRPAAHLAGGACKRRH